jgi:hypothetical protein
MRTRRMNRGAAPRDRAVVAMASLSQSSSDGQRLAVREQLTVLGEQTSGREADRVRIHVPANEPPLSAQAREQNRATSEEGVAHEVSRIREGGEEPVHEQRGERVVVSEPLASSVRPAR